MLTHLHDLTDTRVLGMFAHFYLRSMEALSEVDEQHPLFLLTSLRQSHRRAQQRCSSASQRHRNFAHASDEVCRRRIGMASSVHTRIPPIRDPLESASISQRSESGVIGIPATCAHIYPTTR